MSISLTSALNGQIVGFGQAQALSFIPISRPRLPARIAFGPANRSSPSRAASAPASNSDSPAERQLPDSAPHSPALPPTAACLPSWPMLSPLALAACVAALLLALLPPAALAAGKATAAAAAAIAPPPSPQGVAGFAAAALSFVLHLDVHLGEIVAHYGAATYGILFAIVFAETGLVVTPFLPGDSLLFATGALAALGKLNMLALCAVYVTAATLGDAVNYAVGNYFGARALRSRLVRREYVARTEQFYAHYGGKTVVLARFVPIVRTFAPFVAGVGSMPYSTFAFYNVAGAALWTAVCTGAGYVFGNVPAVRDNFSLVVLGIVVVSVLPVLYELAAARGHKVISVGSGGGAGSPGAVKRYGGGLSVGFR